MTEALPMHLGSAIREFNRIANALAMPVSERRSILGLAPAPAQSWQVKDIVVPSEPSAEFLRRLNYILPLMQRMANDQPVELKAG